MVLLGSVSAMAQITTTYYERKDAFQMRPELILNQNIPTKRMGKVDVEKLLKEDFENESKGLPFRFGWGFDVNYTLKDGTWEESGSWRIWSLKIFSPGAFSLNFVFEELFLSPGAQLNIFNAVGSMVFGPVTDKQILQKGGFQTDIIAGDEVIIQLKEPVEINKSKKENSSLKISRVAHGYKNTFPFISEENTRVLGCYNDVDYDAIWKDASEGVAQLLLNGEHLCTGALLNNTAQNFRPYILTAFHCIDIDMIGGCPDGVLSTTEINRLANWGINVSIWGKIPRL